MATTQELATELAFQDLLSENQKKHEDLRKQQKTITSSPRTLKVNRRNNHHVVNQRNTSTKFKTGFVPIKPASFLSSSSSQPTASILPARARNLSSRNSRMSSMSERTFRKSPSSSYIRYRPFSGTKAGLPKMRATHSFRRNVSEKVSKTTDLWLPSLKNTNLSQLERPFLRPLNAIEQLLNDEVLEPTAGYFHGFKEFVNSKIEASFPAKTPVIYRSNQIIELSESDVDPPPVQPQTQSLAVAQINSRLKKQSLRSPPEPTNQIVRFGVVSQVSGFARICAKKLGIKRIIGGRSTDGGMVPTDDYVEAACRASKVLQSPSRDTLNSLRKDRIPYVMLSACSSFNFGPPIKPYSPVKNVPQLVMSPLSSSSYKNLLLSPGKEVYVTDTIDISDLRTERMKRVLRVRFAFNNVTTDDFTAKNLTAWSADDSFKKLAPLGITFRESASPISCVLKNDPDFKSFMLPLESGETLQSPRSGFVDTPKTGDVFSEFGYQVLHTGDSLDG